MAYYFSRTIEKSFEEAIPAVTEALKKEGFGILSQINITEKLREKLGVDFRKYVILGACNPPLAFKALQLEDKVGVMLPCNVIVQEHESGDLRLFSKSLKRKSLKLLDGAVQGSLKMKK